MGDLDDYTLTLTSFELDMIRTGLATAVEESWLRQADVEVLLRKITTQTGVE